ncbi:MAG: DUF2866 domain-containing protein, partial [Gammaproteobacteria bacterium]|nr:DUF2866 domain-containing protein [Gammaproteobacteria bacterium]
TAAQPLDVAHKMRDAPRDVLSEPIGRNCRIVEWKLGARSQRRILSSASEILAVAGFGCASFCVAHLITPSVKEPAIRVTDHVSRTPGVFGSPPRSGWLQATERLEQ